MKISVNGSKSLSPKGHKSEISRDTYGSSGDSPTTVSYRHKRTTQSTILAKSHVPIQDSLVKVPQAPPVGSHNLPTTFDENSYDHKNSASFLSSGRSSSFVPNTTQYFRSKREEIQRTNLGPGSYELGYSWRTDISNNEHFPSLSTTMGTESSTLRSYSTMKLPAGEYERPWLAEKRDSPISQRDKHLNVINTASDIEIVKALPSY